MCPSSPLNYGFRVVVEIRTTRKSVSVEWNWIRYRPEVVNSFQSSSTVVVECCYQNIGIATSLALTMFEGDELNHAMGIPFFYGVCEAVSVGSFCFLCWKAGWTKAPSDTPLWKVLITSYEIVAVHGDELDDPNFGAPTIQQQTLSESDYVEMGNVHDDPSAPVRKPVSTVANV